MSRWHLSSRQKRIGNLLQLFVHATHLKVSKDFVSEGKQRGLSDANGKLTNGLLVGREPSIMENFFTVTVTVPGLVIVLCCRSVEIHFDLLTMC
jgi:hypothetical protein